MTKPVLRKVRCAVYTRKSTEEGLDMEFNSLDAQREACEAYVLSQKPEGWLLVPDRYDDGGYSGATLERPALRRLLADIEARKVDVVVVYKIDRLSRSLMDFARLVEVFDRNTVTFVSVTQSFNTTTPVLRPVRARGHWRAHSGQVCGLATQGHVDGGPPAPRL
jgi:site-specific DNA recombinase